MPSFIVPNSNSEDAAPLREFNQCHTPTGPDGGQFCATDGTGGGGSAKKSVAAGRVSNRPEARAKGTLGFQSPIGGMVVTMDRDGKSTAEIKAAVKARVLKRAETPEETEFVDFIVDAEIHTARDLRDGDSKSRHSVEDPYHPGQRIYTDERMQVHDAIMEMPDVRNPNAKMVPTDEQPTIVFTGGLPASGKTFAVGDIEASEFGKNAIIVSNDKIKTKFEGYKGSNAYEYHEESSDVAHRLFLQSVAERKNIVYDFTFKDPDTMAARIQILRDAGYRIEGRFTDTDVDVSVSSAIRRAIGEDAKFAAGTAPFRGRYTPIEHIRSSLRILPDGTRTSQNRLTFESLKKYMTAYVIKDNNGLVDFLRAMNTWERGGKTGPKPKGAVPKTLDQKGSLTGT